MKQLHLGFTRANLQLRDILVNSNAPLPRCPLDFNFQFATDAITLDGLDRGEVAALGINQDQFPFVIADLEQSLGVDLRAFCNGPAEPGSARRDPVRPELRTPGRHRSGPSVRPRRHPAERRRSAEGSGPPARRDQRSGRRPRPPGARTARPAAEGSVHPPRQPAHRAQQAVAQRHDDERGAAARERREQLPRQDARSDVRRRRLPAALPVQPDVRAADAARQGPGQHQRRGAGARVGVHAAGARGAGPSDRDRRGLPHAPRLHPPDRGAGEPQAGAGVVGAPEGAGRADRSAGPGR